MALHLNDNYSKTKFTYSVKNIQYIVVSVLHILAELLCVIGPLVSIISLWVANIRTCAVGIIILLMHIPFAIIADIIDSIKVKYT